MTINVVDIIIPRHFLTKCSSHYLLGCYKIFEKQLIVSCLFACSNIREFFNVVDSTKSQNHLGCCKVGYFCHTNYHKSTSSSSQLDLKYSKDVFFVLVIKSTFDIVIERFTFRGHYLNSKCIRIIFYDPEDLINCQLINDLKKNYLIEYLYSVKKTLIILNDCNVDIEEMVFPIEAVYKKNAFLQSILKFLLSLISSIMKLYVIVVKWCPKWFTDIYSKSALGRQLHQKLMYVNFLSEEVKTKTKLSLRANNIMYGILFDLLVGIMVSHILSSHFSSYFLLPKVMSTTNEMVNLLQRLIHWLMGVPAGLKLNIPLNSVLGHFFLYHIYLWKNYINVIQPLFDVSLKLLMSIGFLGFTFILCLVHDIISCATVHIYCFYGYAARLYYYHLCGITSLWRVFRGKKWNPELQRVESYDYDIHVLYVGTLVFTVLLFLLPTVMVYYFAFAMLRIAVLIILNAISKAVHILTVLPIYVVVLRCFNSTLTAGSIAFSVMKQDNTCVLSLQTAQIPFSSLIRYTLPSTVQYGRQMSWKSLFSSLVWGKIIYPL